jgi:small subunit ribosomal protein S27e
LKKDLIPIPKPRSTFVLVKCTKCDNEQIVYSMTNSDVFCKICETLIAEKSGGKSRIQGIIMRRLD